MRTHPKLGPGSILKTNPQNTLRYILLSGSVLGLAISLFLIQSDINQLTKASVSLEASFESPEIKTGERVSLIYTLSGLSEGLEREVDFFAELPSSPGFNYIENSFRVLDGKIENIIINEYGETPVLSLQGEALNEGEEFRFSIDVSIPMDINLVDREFLHTAHCTIGEENFPAKFTPVKVKWNAVQAEKVVIEPQSGAIADGRVTYEVQLKNPENGITFGASSYQISFSERFEDTEVRIEPESIQFDGGNKRGEILSQNNRLIVQDLDLRPGEEVKFRYSVQLPAHYTFTEDVKSMSKLMVPGTHILQALETKHASLLP